MASNTKELKKRCYGVGQERIVTSVLRSRLPCERLSPFTPAPTPNMWSFIHLRTPNPQPLTVSNPNPTQVLTAREQRLRETMAAVARALGCTAAAKAAVIRHPDVLLTKPDGIQSAMGALEQEFGRDVAVVAATRHAR